MKVVKIISIIVVVLIVVVLALVGAGIYFTNRYLQTPAFKEEVLKAARSALGTDVSIDSFQASLFSGVELHGVTIGNPTGFTGNLLTAEAFTLRYRLLPLLSRRVEIKELSLDKPIITLSQNDKNEWNYEAIGTQEDSTNSKPIEVKPTPAAPTPATSAKAEAAAPLDIVLSKLAITQGALSLVSDKDKAIVKVEGINFSSAVSLIDKKLAGTARAGIDEINLSDALFVKKVATSVTLVTDEVKLAPLTGKVADGTLAGDVAVNFGDGLKYTVNLQVKDSDVAKLLQDAKTKPVMSGKLTATTALTGTGGLPTIVGNGRAEIDGGQLMEIPILNLLAGLLQMDALHDLKFSECVLEFSISNNVMQTPVIRLTSPQVQITGKGSVALADYSLNHDLTITFAKGALGTAPKEILGLFTEQANGSLALSFHVSGPYSSPKTDLTQRIAQGLGQQLIEKGLQKLFK
ncbi:MAG TPA: AsmA-like C-terminal region-containing protein [Verrucomicrobiae bacterium]|nr:AsmA-like C-terminal region-containing protein [Verrucomicrobiae bacterium]